MGGTPEPPSAPDSAEPPKVPHPLPGTGPRHPFLSSSPLHRGARARGGAEPELSVLGLCPGPGRVPTRGDPHVAGLVPWAVLCPSSLPAGDPPCPPLCFAAPAACSRRLPRLVARFQPPQCVSKFQPPSSSPCVSPRPALPCPVPQPPARQGLSSAEEGRARHIPGTLPARSGIAQPGS